MNTAEERLALLIQEISSIHREMDGGSGFAECFEDVEDWPCRTIQAVWKAQT